MGQGLWRGLARLLPFARTEEPGRDDRPAITLDELGSSLSDEFRGLRKMLRKQGETIEVLKRRLDEAPEDSGRQAAVDGDALMRLAQTFFHLDRALRRGQPPCSASQQQAIDLAWLQVEDLLGRAEITLIRETGVPFDPRLHQAMAVHDGGCGRDQVLEVLEPGFVEGGAVRRPAKVLVGAAAPTTGQPSHPEDDKV